MDDGFATDIENALFELGDPQVIRNRIVTARDIATHYSLLSSAIVNDEIIAYLIFLFVDAYQKKERFQRKKSIIALKRVIRNRSHPNGLPQPVVAQLFYVFQEYVFDRNETTQWAVSTMLKDQVLLADQLAWLIGHCDQTVHALNRLLRHPTVPLILEDWAKQCIENGTHMDRLSELLGLIIKSSSQILALIEHYGGNAVAWGICHARVETSEKQSLLQQMPLEPKSFQSYVSVSQRLGLSDALAAQLRQRMA